MKAKHIFLTVLISVLTSVAIIYGYSNYIKNDNTVAGQVEGAIPSNYKYAGLNDKAPFAGPADFTQPAAASIPTVVHIKTKTNAKQINNGLPKTQKQNPFSDFFDDDAFNQLFGNSRPNVIPEQRASGSGVIISEDGYIVTNNHVVSNADEIMVTLNNKKTYKAKVIGTDQAYDLAVIKVEAAGLPYLIYGNSDEVQIGQWVLAIGYPLNLETTVTAGIVSAKSRSLGLNRDKSGNPGGGVESFIQTDAAVNMGNSGGALVNTDGKLIGINSAIASYTGYYSGYSYAIPVNIVKKVVDDIMKFGTVQRAYLGINFRDAGDLSDEQKTKEGLPLGTYGIYVAALPEDGAAYIGGIRKGDVIKKVNGVTITNGSELQEQISRYKPGDKVPVTILRKDKESTLSITLKNKAGNFDIVTKDAVKDLLGAELVALDSKKAKEFGVPGGVIVKKINPGTINDQTRMKDGFIILKIDNKDVKTIEDINAALGNNSNVTISGFYPGYDGLYEYPLSLGE